MVFLIWNNVFNHKKSACVLYYIIEESNIKEIATGGKNTKTHFFIV